MDTNQYMDMFLDESHEHLQSLNDGLLSLEDNMEDTSVVNEIFRNAHTLKGMSATMGFNKIAELTHEMEDVLDLIRKEQLKLNEDIIDTLFKCVDSLGQMIDSVGNGEAEDVVDVSDLVKKLSSISKPDQAAAQAAAPAAAAAAAPAENKISIELADVDKDVIKQAQETGMQAIHVRVTLAETCLLKSARSYMVMNALDELGDVIKSVPSAEDLEQEKFDHSFDVIIITAAEEKAVQDAVNSISEISKVETNVIDLAAEEKAAAATAAAPAPKAAAPAPTAKKAAPAPAKKATAAPAKKVHHSQSVRVDIEKLDTLMNLMGELVINKVRLEQIGQTHRLADLTDGSRDDRPPEYRHESPHGAGELGVQPFPAHGARHRKRTQQGNQPYHRGRGDRARPYRHR